MLDVHVYVPRLTMRATKTVGIVICYDLSPHPTENEQTLCGSAQSTYGHILLAHDLRAGVILFYHNHDVIRSRHVTTG